MKPRIRLAALVLSLSGASLALPAAHSSTLIPQAGRGVVAPTGFAAIPWAATPIVPTTLTWGPDTAAAGLRSSADQLHGTLLYVGGVAGNPISCDGCGQVIAFSDERALVTPMADSGSTAVAEGFNSVLGVAFGPDDTMYVTDNINSRGRVLSVKDVDGDGYFEQQRVLLKNIPNGRHQTNGLSVGPDGMVYVANGNATDDGLDCGPDAIPGGADSACPDPERLPWTGSILRVDPSWNNVDLMTDVVVDGDERYAANGLDDESVLVARGFRNIYDVDFRPGAPNEIWTPMNGPDNPSGSEPIYGLPIDDERQIVVGTDPETGQPIFEPSPIIENAGFPSCLFDPHNNDFPRPQSGHTHPGNPEPQNSLNTAVLAQFGECPLDTVYRPRTVLNSGHEGTSGLAFERGNNFPARYDGDLFIAEWGSIWNLNGANPTGHKIVRVSVNPDGSVSGDEQEFFTSPLPIDLTFGPDGFMYIADMTGQIYMLRFVTEVAASEVVVEMREPGVFVPATIPVVQGQTVRWINNTTSPKKIDCVRKVVAENPTEGDPLPSTCVAPRSPIIPAGGEFRYTFDDEVAVYHLESKVGAEGTTMQGTVVVTPLER